MARPQNKELAILSVIALYTIVFFWIAASFFRGQQEFTVSFGSWLSVAGVVWVALVAFSSACTRDRNPIFLTIALVPAVVLLLVGQFTLAALVGALILFILTLSAQRSIAGELQGHIKIRIATVFSTGVRTLLFGMLLSFVVLATPLVQKTIASGAIRIPDAYLMSVSKSVAAIVHQDPKLIAQTTQDYITTHAAGSGLEVTVIIIAVALLAVRAIVPFITYPALAFIFIFFWIAKKTNLITVSTRDVPVEFIQL